MPDWKGTARSLIRPQVAIPTATLAATGVTAVILGFFMQRWVYVIVALLVLLLGLLAFLVYSLYSKERESRVARGVAADGDATVIRRKERRAEIGLEEGFRKAVAVIEARQLGHLPWYLVLGGPGAGKTALLRASGLELPAAVERLVELGPTSSCNWWLTNQAVVIDTAGRYSAAHEGGDHREWKRLLALVRKHRPRPALQGVIVALSAADLLSKEGPQLEADASELRRHLNEIVDGIGVDAPIYLVVTGADRIQGFSDAAARFAGTRLHEAFGWTNHKRYPHDIAQTVREGFGQIRDRIEGMLPDLLIREPEPTHRRRLFFLPQEISALSRSVSAFAGRAFAPALYDEAPFLRGVYLTSAMREGTIVSPVVSRLGHAWAQGPVDASGPSGSWFLHDFFRRLLLDSEEQTLTVPADRVGPRTRAVLLGLAAAAAAVMAVFWGVSAWNNWKSIQAIHEAAVDTRDRRESLDAVDRLQQTLIATEAARGEAVHGMGLGGPLERAIERGRRVFLSRFGHDFEEPSKQVLLSSVKGSGDEAFASLQDLAVDVDYLASRAADGSSAPDLAHYSDVRRSDSERVAFAAAYAAFARWAPQLELESRIEVERQRLDEEAPRLLDVARLQAWCASHPELVKPIRYQDLGLPPPGPEIPDSVSGCFRRTFFEERLGGLIRGLERSGKVSQESAERFLDDYARRYAESWEDFLVGAPRPALADPDVARSPYVKLLERIEENVAVAELWRRGEPSWVRKLREIRNQEPAKEGEQASWPRYQALLETVDAEVERVRGRSQLSFDAARAVADGQENIFKKAVDHVAKSMLPIEAAEEDRTPKLALRSILMMPILNGFSSVLESAAREIDQRWREQIVAPFPPPLSPDAHERLYGPGGVLERFRRETLSPFIAGSEPRPLLEERALPLMGGFVQFATGGGRGGAGGGGGGMPVGPQTVRLIGAPSDVRGADNVYVTSQELTLVCATRPEQRFEYTDGVGEKVFTWTPDCVLVQLMVRVRGSDGRESELPREWSGPYAFSTFLREGNPVGDGSQQWIVRDQTGSGVSVAVRYRQRGGEGILRAQQAASQTLPSSAVN